MATPAVLPPPSTAVKPTSVSASHGGRLLKVPRRWDKVERIELSLLEAAVYCCSFLSLSLFIYRLNNRSLNRMIRQMKKKLKKSNLIYIKK